MPHDNFHGALSRYETLHLRQVLDTSRTLDALQKNRQGKQSPPPPA
jgi:hypothetical protein